MSSSDDEGETFPDTVSDYYFYNGDDEPLSFSKLAVCWNESESKSYGTTEGPIFLRGSTDNGLQKVYQQVKAWKFDLSKAHPEISVLSKDNHWIKLQKPRKSFENVIRTILITVHCLYFCKTKPEASWKSLWDHLSKVFSLYDLRPSENDLIDHLTFIREAVKRDETLATSKLLAAFLENPRKRRFPEDSEIATKPSFIADDMNDEPQDDVFVTKQIEDSDSDEEGDHFDSVCAICDNGGELTCCEGKCFRSFHANKDSEEAMDSNCESLRLRPEKLKGMQQFLCENCLYSRHQCFVCGELGSSDRSLGAEVFRCSSATCGHFYHPQCVAELLQQDGEAETHDLEKKIAAGEPFICPAHKCAVCKQTENEKVEDLQFAICRRCPRSYHRKCLPGEIMFDEQLGDDDLTRAWDNLLSKSRALIYCLDHEIDPELGTPARTLKFRNIDPSKKVHSSELLQKKKKEKKVAIKERGTGPERTSKEKRVLNSQKGFIKSSAVKMEDSSKKRVASSSGPESLKKMKMGDGSGKSLKRNLSTKVATPSQSSLGSRLFDYMHKGTDSNNLEKVNTTLDDNNETMATKSLQKEYLPTIDDKTKQRMQALMKDAASSITLEEVKKYHKDKVPSTHAHSSRVDKSIILARVEGSVEALHVALKKLEEGCSIEDAMAVCDPGVIAQILRWKEKLRVYLAPFLHGMRYTSFGRHFTKVEKLEKIVDKLQWYIEDGDMVVDFCCGANDFSCLVKKRLDEMGKKRCSYKNYDITQPKNDFNFEKRDWMTVRPKELPTGSRLVMGLNPPFGVNACLANQFIAKALQFKPKLLVLIVPPETERLDSEKNRIPYDLVWEDVNLLAGKSFYLPGSLDANDKQTDQWNLTPPPLYLWSRPDWTNKHKAVALEHGHILEVPEASRSDEIVSAPRLSKDNNEKEADLPTPLNDPPIVTEDLGKATDKEKPNVKKWKKEDPAPDNSGTETKMKNTPKEKPSNQNSNKRNWRNQESQTEKREDKDKQSPAPTRKLDDRRSPVLSRRDQPQKLDNRPSPAQKLDERRSPAQKFDDKRSPAQRFDDKRSSASSSRDRAEKPEKKQHFLAPTSQTQSQKPDESKEILNSDLSYWNEIEPSFDKNLERRYNFTADESDFSFKNDSYDPHLDRRHNTVTTYRQPEGPNLSTPSYSMRPEPVQYSSYERVNRGPYVDEMRSISGYPVIHQEPGLTRYNPVDTGLYNRTSSSTMQRYAPRLDEMNHTRMNNLGRSELDEMMNQTRMSNMVRPEPPIASRGMMGYGLPMHGPGLRGDPMGFVPGPSYPPYTQHNTSSGWLNE